METKKFKAFEKIILRYNSEELWDCDFYSYYDEKEKFHVTFNHVLTDAQILPYEGNEHLVGTNKEPDEEIKLKEGELIITTDYIGRMKRGLGGILGRFEKVGVNSFFTEGNCACYFAIRFSDFNPNDMEETKKHILCVKNGRIVKYKD